jgi:PAS domain-containing protein
VQEPLRVLIVEPRGAEHAIAAQLLTDYDLAFSWQHAASPRDLSKIAEDFKPHIVLCTDDGSVDSNHGILGALRLLCSQTPIILISSVCKTATARAGRSALRQFDGKRPPLPPPKSSRIPQDAADLQTGFAAVLDSSAQPAVISDAEGWITHANTRACRLLEACDRSLVTVLRATHDQSPQLPHWLPVSHNAGGDPAVVAASIGTPSQRRHHRLAYFDSWSLLPTSVHVDDLIGCATAYEREYRPALAVIAVDRDGARISGDRCEPAPSGELSGDGPDTPPAATRYGSIVRISPDDYLVVLAEPSRPVDAATTVRCLLDSMAATAETTAHLPQSRASTDLHRTAGTARLRARRCDSTARTQRALSTAV